jgi:hypothetical protein
MEMMSGAAWVRERLQAAGWTVQIAHARKAKAVGSLAAKTDKLDARVLSLSDLLCVRSRRRVDGRGRRQPGNRSSKWILRPARAAVQARLRCHLASALISAR